MRYTFEFFRKREISIPAEVIVCPDGTSVSNLIASIISGQRPPWISYKNAFTEDVFLNLSHVRVIRQYKD